MTGLWLEDQSLSVRCLPIPSPTPDEALIKVRLSGICGTDIELARGYYPLFSGILGHEFVGEVVAAPGDASLVGQRVVGEINVACGGCAQCRALFPTHCEQRSVLGIVNRDGVFADFLTLPIRNLHPVPNDVPDEAAVFVEPIAAACRIAEQVMIGPRDRVLLIGGGRLGQIIAQVLGLTACDLKVVVKYPGQKALLEHQGIAVQDATSIPSRSMDVVVEATGDGSGYALAVSSVRPRGTVVLKSTYRSAIEVDFSSLVVDEVTVVGSRCGPFDPALRLLRRGQIDPTLLIEAIYPLCDGIKAFEHAQQAGAMKVLLRP
ncbi:MAG: alcohol dehydrogenase catalytic domain-containing protein [Myxococcota bacterium]|nr:alcohol dehydrogenase catalytic domain-containing protein [Myxococcota bacterium]